MLARLNMALETHMAHWGHGICMIISNVLTHIGHGHFGIF